MKRYEILGEYYDVFGFGILEILVPSENIWQLYINPNYEEVEQNDNVLRESSV